MSLIKRQKTIRSVIIDKNKSLNKDKTLQEYIFISKYAQTKNYKKESWEEAVTRVMDMHEDYLVNTKNIPKEVLTPYLDEVTEYYTDQKILGAQRALQWGGDQLLKHQFRLYNCAASHADRPGFFGELMFVLLNGAGVGYSVQDHHVVQLPDVESVEHASYRHTVEDSIEGWADAIDILVESYYNTHYTTIFDYSKIRPKGSEITGGFIAPGYKPLETAIELIRVIFNNALRRKLTALEVHEISCIIADAVISGGVRRSALVALFTISNKGMLECKTGDWFYKKPYLGRANNSAVILPDTHRADYLEIFKSVKEYGEPGFAFLPDKEVVFNPCFN